MAKSEAQNVTPIAPSQELAPVQRQVITPMDMIMQAVSSGAQMDVVEKLMALQERYQANEARKAFNAAMADAKAEIKPIFKNRKVDFTGEKGRTQYDHEDLAEIARTVDPVLATYGLNYRWRSRQDGASICVACIMAHRDGYSEETELSSGRDDSGKKNNLQALGSAITYLQRYTLKLALGLSASKDDDARTTGETGELISEEQITQLNALAKEVGADLPKFCAWAGVESLDAILASKFPDAKKALEAKRRKVGA